MESPSSMKRILLNNGLGMPRERHIQLIISQQFLKVTKRFEIFLLVGNFLGMHYSMLNNIKYSYGEISEFFLWQPVN